MRLEFLMCGVPTDAFWSQAAMFRLALDRLGGAYRRARLVLCVGAARYVPLPERWRPHFSGIELAWADEAEFLRDQDGAQSNHLYRLLDHTADLSVLCDADTLLVRPFPKASLEAWQASPAIRGVIAHYPPPRATAPGRPSLPPMIRNDEMWATLARHVLGRTIALPHRYALAQPERCPFYINYGLVVAPPVLLRRLYTALVDVEPRVRQVLDNEFYGQIGIALAVERDAIPVEALPVRFNFPNESLADETYPDELPHIVLLHYLRTAEFDRHRIFAEQDAFDAFLARPLTGSNEVFRRHVRRLTGGRYPF